MHQFHHEILDYPVGIPWPRVESPNNGSYITDAGVFTPLPVDLKLLNPKLLSVPGFRIWLYIARVKRQKGPSRGQRRGLIRV